MKIDNRYENLLRIFFAMTGGDWYKTPHDLRLIHDHLSQEQLELLNDLHNSLVWAKECGPSCVRQLYRHTGLCDRTLEIILRMFAQWAAGTWEQALLSGADRSRADRAIKAMHNNIGAFLGIAVPYSLVDASLRLGLARTDGQPAEELEYLNERIEVEIRSYCG